MSPASGDPIYNWFYIKFIYIYVSIQLMSPASGDNDPFAEEILGSDMFPFN